MALIETISGKLGTIKDKLDIFPFANDAAVLGALIGLSYIGIALTRVSPGTSQFYWMIVIPIFGVISYFAQVQLLGSDTGKWSGLLRTQLFHWIGLWVAVLLTYRLLGVGLLDYESVGFVVLVLMAFAFFLQGVYVDWRFYIVGVFLAASLLVAMYVAAYLWILLALAIASVAAGVWYIRRRGGAPQATS